MSDREPPELDARLEELFARERAIPAVRDDVRARMAARLPGPVGGGSPGGGAGPRAAGARAAWHLPSGLAGFAAGAVVTGALFATLAASRAPTATPPLAQAAQSISPPRAAASSDSSPVSVASAPHAAPAAASPITTAIPNPQLAPRTTPPSARHGGGEPSTTSPELDLDRERRLIDAARSALATGNAAAALAIVERHRRQAPDGALSEERDALEIRALRALNSGDRAAEALQAFERRYPSSVFLRSLREPRR